MRIAISYKIWQERGSRFWLPLLFDVGGYGIVKIIANRFDFEHLFGILAGKFANPLQLTC